MMFLNVLILSLILLISMKLLLLSFYRQSRLFLSFLILLKGRCLWQRLRRLKRRDYSGHIYILDYYMAGLTPNWFLVLSYVR
ncbi:MAG: hypothetical protein [Microviridae sp.]|nr:MAG: hypothetical protein [Microviridae sp.]